MILSTLDQIGQLAVYGERMKAAAEYITTHDLSTLEPGHHQIDGEDIFVNVQHAAPKSIEEAKIETHDRYIDIQIPFSGIDTMGYIPRKELPEAEYNADCDMTLYEGLCPNYIGVTPGQFAVFFPEDGHAPAITPVELKKAIVKVKI